MSDEPTSLKRLVVISVATALIAISIRTFVFQLYSVPSSSMVPSLIIGDCMVVSKYAYGYGSEGTFGGLLPFKGRFGGKPPKRGDIIVFKNPVSGITFLKRLIGLPGDKIKVLYSDLYINNVQIRREAFETPVSFPGDDEPTADIIDYAEFLPDRAPHLVRLYRHWELEPTVNNTAEFVVPQHQYFFMGDNRDNSMDSRLTGLGFVPEEYLVGKAQFLFFSIEKDASVWKFWDWPWSVRHHRLWMTIN